MEVKKCLGYRGALRCHIRDSRSGGGWGGPLSTKQVKPVSLLYYSYKHSCNSMFIGLKYRELAFTGCRNYKRVCDHFIHQIYIAAHPTNVFHITA